MGSILGYGHLLEFFSLPRAAVSPKEGNSLLQYDTCMLHGPIVSGVERMTAILGHHPTLQTVLMNLASLKAFFPVRQVGQLSAGQTKRCIHRLLSPNTQCSASELNFNDSVNPRVVCHSFLLLCADWPLPPFDHCNYRPAIDHCHVQGVLQSTWLV